MKTILGEIVRAMDLQTTTAPGERMRSRAIARSPGGKAEIVIARRTAVAGPEVRATVGG